LPITRTSGATLATPALTSANSGNNPQLHTGGAHTEEGEGETEERAEVRSSEIEKRRGVQRCLPRTELNVDHTRRHRGRWGHCLLLHLVHRHPLYCHGRGALRSERAQVSVSSDGGE
jgi:hypothetical protein